MKVILAIIFAFIGISIAKEIPEHAWIGIGIVLVCIALFVAAWFALAYLVRAFLKIALKIKD